MLFIIITYYLLASLGDEHVLELSKRITSGEELVELGINGLGIPEFKIKAVMYDHSDSIQAATHDLLSTWLKQQTDTQEAYMNLCASLRRCQMNQLAIQLTKWVEGTDVAPQITNRGTLVLMAYSHCRTRTRIRTQTRIPNPMVTLYYVEIFTLVRIWIRIPVQTDSQIVTVPILGTDIHPGDRCLSLFHTCQSGDQSPDPNQCEISA